MSSQLPPDLLELAQRQCGVVTRGQAAESGLSRSNIASHLHYGRWQLLYRGVYATFSGEPGRLATFWAAVLSAGPGAMLSYHTAAELSGLTDKPAELIHVTIPSDRRVARSSGVIVHLSERASQALHPARLPPQTRVEETVLDLAGIASSIDDACAWLIRALQRRKTTQGKLRAALEERSRMRWRPELAQLLTADYAGLDSILELRYHRDVERRHGLPGGAASRQVRFRSGQHNEYRDVEYEEYLTVVELDGRLAHPDERRRQDIRRDNAAAAIDGIVTLRYGWLDVTGNPCLVASEVARVLSRRGFASARPCSLACPVGRVAPGPAAVAVRILGR